jgi:predicted RNA-binding Zn-ribbon protein involved in translation (DUF1610 family)
MAEYIERNAVLAEYDRQHKGPPGGVRKIIAEFPAADVRPVVRGFNVRKDYPSLFECSVCGWSDDDTTTGDTQTYNYCPNCGADMMEKCDEDSCPIGFKEG